MPVVAVQRMSLCLPVIDLHRDATSHCQIGSSEHAAYVVSMSSMSQANLCVRRHARQVGTVRYMCEPGSASAASCLRCATGAS
jgi:hypothetical protein